MAARHDPEARFLKKAALLWSIAAVLPAGVVGGYFLGWLLDRWLGSSPWFALAGLLLGTAGAFWETVRIAQKAWEDEDENRNGSS